MSLVLVEANEERRCLVYFEVFNLSTSESQTPEIDGFITIITDCVVKMEAFHDRLCDRVA